jgi:pimeloyl-ACP methyl ester carboxylesterase
MAKYLLSVISSVIVFVPLTRAQSVPSHTWKLADMKPRGITETSTGSRREVEILPAQSACGLAKCKFDVYYFRGAHFDASDAARKNILFVSGGPGQIVSREPPERRPLHFLEADHNVFYFDIRGAGLSTIDGDNKYDRFLRGDYVVNDIEQIRLKELGPSTPWDAIYAHSAGTVIAQKYAAKQGPGKVRRVILSAPIAKHRDTELARLSMIVSNLEQIYKNYRNSSSCPIGIGLFEALGFSETPDDLCFVRTEQVAAIKRRLTDTLTQFNKSYGSVGFVLQNHEELLRNDKEFAAAHRFPVAFSRALRVLEQFGAPEKGLGYSSDIKKKQVDAVLLIGYYLSFESGDLPDPEVKCNKNAPFWAGLRGAVLDIWPRAYCKRLNKVKSQTGESPNVSVRANEAFGIYDGVSRSVFGMLKQHKLVDKQTNCFTGKDFLHFATNAQGSNTKVAREAAKKIGVGVDDRFCPWNPTTSENKHGVPTLILKGGADAAINGCQAEDIFNDALTGQRILIEFHGAGHSMQLPIRETEAGQAEEGQLISSVVQLVLETAPADFSKVAKKKTVQMIKERKRGEVHSSDEMNGHRLKCKPS